MLNRNTTSVSGFRDPFLRRTLRRGACLFLGVLGAVLTSAEESTWPPLPDRDGPIEIPAQEWPARPGPRRVRVLVHYPQGKLASVNAKTGLMLTLHNWGGEDCIGTSDPRTLANELNVVACCVNYLQSGAADAIEASEPYDFGYLQALDALRALWLVRQQLVERQIPFANDRIFATGGSGGGNVTLMSNKLAPRTFTCIVDMCGMKKLSDDIAFNLPGGSRLNARWSRDPNDAAYLTPDHQELRFVGHPEHLQQMKKLGTESRIIIVHGVDDKTCPFEHAQELVAALQHAELKVEPHFIDKSRLDGEAFTSTGHALGNRTKIVLNVAGRYLRPDSDQALRRRGPTDFERGDEIRYETTNGEFVISYKSGFPLGRFEPRQ